jgi:hypothetical protein
MAGIQPKGASAKALAALNGSSSGTTGLWSPEPDDYILGRITLIEELRSRYADTPRKRYSLLVEEGSEQGGVPIEPGEHRAIFCARKALVEMTEQLDPQVGEEIAVAYLGRVDGVRHWYRFSKIAATPAMAPASNGSNERW